MRSIVWCLVLAVTVAACGGGQSSDPVVDARSPDAAGPGAAASPEPGAADADGDASGPTSAATGQRYPDIVDVELDPLGDGVYDVRVTVSSPYDTPQRYADGWRVLTPDGDVLGTHTLAHDHANEQPFTRTQGGVEIPADVDEVTVEGRDQRFGFGGDTVTVDVPR